MNNILIGFISIVATFIIFIFSVWLNKRYAHPFTLPVLISTILIIAVLLLFNISYNTYYIGAQWIERLLGPAVVALAYPLYQHRDLVKKNALPIIIGVFIGSFVGVFSGLVMAKLIGFEDFIILSLLPKSVTSPVAMDIASTIGGSPAIAIVLVMIAGIGGAVVGPSLLKRFGVHHYLAKGLGMGSASHAIGTAKAMEMDQREGAISTIAMVLSAIIVSFITPLIVTFIM